MPQRTAGVRAAARADDIGITEGDRHPIEGDAEKIRRDLGKARFMPLPRGLSADHNLDASGCYDKVDPLVRRSNR